MTRKSSLTEIAYGSLGIYFIIFLLTVAFHLVPETVLTFRIAMGLLLLSCLLQSVEVFGLKTTAFFFVFASLTGWVAEQIAISYGIIFPRYHYGNLLGNMIGDVPMIIPPSWFVFTYCAFLVAGLMTRTNAGTEKARILLPAFLGGFIMACLDLALEPLALLRHYWMWENTEHLVATQLRIFAGWIFWGFFIQLVMRLWNVPARLWDPRQKILPVFILLGIGLYASWITAREWNPIFAFLTLSTLGSLSIISLKKGL